MQRVRYSSSSAGVSAPDWVLQVSKLMDKKSEMLAAFFKQLDPAQIPSLLALKPQTQVYMCASALLNPAAWKNINEYVVRCMTTWQKLQASEIMPLAAGKIGRAHV